MNSSGGLLGRQVQLKILNDNSSPTQVVTNYQTLINAALADWFELSVTVQSTGIVWSSNVRTAAAPSERLIASNLPSIAVSSASGSLASAASSSSSGPGRSWSTPRSQRRSATRSSPSPRSA